MWNIKLAALATLVFVGGAQWLPPVTPVVRQQIIRTVIVADFEHRVDQYVGLHSFFRRFCRRSCIATRRRRRDAQSRNSETPSAGHA